MSSVVLGLLSPLGNGGLPRVVPKHVASKRKKAKKIVIDNPAEVHRELKLYLICQKAMVERSALPERRRMVREIEKYLTYLRGLEATAKGPKKSKKK